MNYIWQQEKSHMDSARRDSRSGLGNTSQLHFGDKLCLDFETLRVLGPECFKPQYQLELECLFLCE